MTSKETFDFLLDALSWLMKYRDIVKDGDDNGVNELIRVIKLDLAKVKNEELEEGILLDLIKFYDLSIQFLREDKNVRRK